MSEFRPHRNLVLTIGGRRYGFLAHPYFPQEPEEVYAVEGAEAIVYQVQDLDSGELRALKVSKGSFRGPHIARAVAALAPYAAVPGLAFGARICLTAQTHFELTALYPDLEYAVLMPWVVGRTWSGWLADRAASEGYTIYSAYDLSRAAARRREQLERYHLAHTDLAGGNVIIAPDFRSIALLDLENLYRAGDPPPVRKSRGTPGYRHHQLGADGQWCPEGDRFAGAVLLVEMLTWWDPAVRALTPAGAESLFQQHELHALDTPRWQAARATLWRICQPALALFDQAWSSASLRECPELGVWARAVNQIAL